MEGDLHANNNQKGSADKAHVAEGLENKAKSFSSKTRRLPTNWIVTKALGQGSVRESIGKCRGGMHYLPGSSIALCRQYQRG